MLCLRGFRKIYNKVEYEDVGQKDCMKWIQNLLELGKSFNVIHCLHIICTVLLRVNRCVVAG